MKIELINQYHLGDYDLNIYHQTGFRGIGIKEVFSFCISSGDEIIDSSWGFPSLKDAIREGLKAFKNKQ